jgi:hypothetical protein
MRTLAFSASGQSIAAGGRNGRIRVWDLSQGQFKDIAAHARRVRSVVFAHDDQQLLSAGEDRVVRQWDVPSGTLVRQLPGESGKVLAMVLVGRDRLVTASTDNIIRIWNLGTSELVTSLTGHTGSIAALAAYNGLLVSGGFDATVRVWSLPPQGQVLGQLSQPVHDRLDAMPARN